MIETEAEFVERHGSEYARVNPTEFGMTSMPHVDARLFADGALMVCDMKGEWRRFEPPAEKAKRLASRQKFARIKLTLAETAFNSLRTALTLPGHPWTWGDAETQEFGPSSRDAKTDLTRLRDIVHRRREALAKIEAEIDALPENVAAREAAAKLAEMEQASREAWAKRQAEFAAVTL